MGAKAEARTQTILKFADTDDPDFLLDRSRPEPVLRLTPKVRSVLFAPGDRPASNHLTTTVGPEPETPMDTQDRREVTAYPTTDSP